VAGIGPSERVHGIVQQHYPAPLDTGPHDAVAITTKALQRCTRECLTERMGRGWRAVPRGEIR